MMTIYLLCGEGSFLGSLSVSLLGCGVLMSTKKECEGMETGVSIQRNGNDERY